MINMNVLSIQSNVSMYFNSENYSNKCTTETWGFLLGLIDEQLKKIYGTLFWYITAARFCTKRWKTLQIPTMGEWMVKLIKLDKMAKLDWLKKKKISLFLDGKHFWIFYYKLKKILILVLWCNDYECLWLQK